MSGISLPKIPQDLEKIALRVIQELIALSGLALTSKSRSEYEEKLTRDLKNAAHGDPFLFFTVSGVDRPANTVTLMFHQTNLSVESLRQLKLGLLRLEITVEPFVNLTDSSSPPLKVRELTSFALEIDFDGKQHKVGLGYSQDYGKDTKSKQVLVGVLWKQLKFYLFGILGNSEQGGVLIDVQGDSPFAIPLGPTGLALAGIGLLYGERFAPLLPGATPQTAMDRLATATALDYGNWAAAGKSLDTWVAVPDEMKLFGVSATVVDAPSGGNVIRIEQAGIAYIDYGPTIAYTGGLRLLDLLDAGELVGVVDFRSKSMFGRATQTIELIENALAVVASLESYASLTSPRDTYVAIGGYHMNGCHVDLIGLFHLIGGMRIVPAQGVAKRAAGQIKGSFGLLGIESGFSLSLDLAAEFGWDPFVLGGHLGMAGSAWIKVWGLKIGLGIGLVTTLQIAEPELFTIDLVFTLNLCWPLKDLHFRTRVFGKDDKNPANPVGPLRFGPLDPLSWFHGPSGIMGQISAQDTELWPDAALSVDFQRQAGGVSDIFVNPDDGVHNEANVTVSHAFKTLRIQVWDAMSRVFINVPGIRASWLNHAYGDKSDTTSRLAIPCTDPVGWLYPFDYAQPSTMEPVERLRLQTFGKGPSQLFDVPARGGYAAATFEEVGIESPEALALNPVPTSSHYDRALISRRIAVEFSVKAPGGDIPLVTSYCELRLLGSLKGVQIGVQNGTPARPMRVRQIDRDLAEWSIAITRTPAQGSHPLIVASEQVFQLVAIGYLVRQEIQNSVPDVTVLKPGRYRLEIAGKSSAHYKRHDSARPPTWDVVREFNVVPPPLRPYVRYSTLGDERNFGLDAGGWNPNPRGAGFGHYPEHLGLIRFRVHYFSRIYRRLWIATIQDPLTPLAETVAPSREGTLAGTVANREWYVATGRPIPVEEEVTFAAPTTAGTHRMQVFRSLADDGSDLTVIDDWTYRVSRYPNPVAHLTPSLDGFNFAFGPFGSRRVVPLRPPPLPAALDFDAIDNAMARPDSVLPEFISEYANLKDPQAGLGFLRVLEWCGVFEADPTPLGEGVMLRPDNPDLSALLDRGASPLGMLLRTSEPVDWRRIDITLLVAPFDVDGNRLTTRLIPSPDGCACIVVAMAGDAPVRLPRGAIAVRLRFRLQAAGLPRLTVTANPARETEEIRFALDQPFGVAW